MTKGILVVSSGPSSAERDGEYNDWYNDVHLPDVLKLAGFTSARRFKKIDGPANDKVPYLALYEVEGDDLPAILAGLNKGVASGDVRMTDAITVDPAVPLALYEFIGELTA
jgi:hypothetical protein